jgi:hypothetical protein
MMNIRGPLYLEGRSCSVFFYCKLQGEGAKIRSVERKGLAEAGHTAPHVKEGPRLSLIYYIFKARYQES